MGTDMLLCPRVFTLCFLCAYFTHGQDTGKHDKMTNNQDFKSYAISFYQKRNEQKSAVEHILQLEYARQYDMVKLITDKIFQILQKGFEMITSAGVPGEFPSEDANKEGYALIVENTAFICDLSLYFPDLMHTFIGKNATWSSLLSRAFLFCEQSGLFVKKHGTMLNLAAQELGLKEKEPDFENPYRQRTKKEDPIKVVPSAEKKKKRKEKRKPGPRLSRSEF